MSTLNTLKYEVYNKRSFMVLGDRQKYGKILKTIGGRWNSRLKGGPGWTVPKDKEEETATHEASLEKKEGKPNQFSLRPSPPTLASRLTEVLDTHSEFGKHVRADILQKFHK